MEKGLRAYNFQPIVNKSKPKYSDEPIAIKGLSKHKEKMDNARKIKIEKEEREKEVFSYGSNWGKDGYVTVPKPFNLSYQNVRSKNKESLLNEKYSLII